MMNRFFYTILTISFFFINSCGSESTSPVASNKEFTLSVETKVKGNSLVLGKYFELNNGDSIMVERLDFYMTQMNASYKKESTLTIDTTFLYSKSNTSNKIYIKSSSIPNQIDTIKFLCGLSDALNNGNPNNYANKHPLSSYTNMYWTAWTKYRYVILEGKIKSASKGEQSFSYHAGLGYKAFAIVPCSFSINTNSTNEHKLILNVDRIFYPLSGAGNINYKNGETFAHSEIADAELSDKFSVNFAKAFIVE